MVPAGRAFGETVMVEPDPEAVRRRQPPRAPRHLHPGILAAAGAGVAAVLGAVVWYLIPGLPPPRTVVTGLPGATGGGQASGPGPDRPDPGAPLPSPGPVSGGASSPPPAGGSAPTPPASPSPGPMSGAASGPTPSPAGGSAPAPPAKPTPPPRPPTTRPSPTPKEPPASPRPAVVTVKPAQPGPGSGPRPKPDTAPGLPSVDVMRAQVEDRLRGRGLLRGSQSDGDTGLTVEVSPERVVTLRGIVRDAEQRDEAVRLARVNGVAEVRQRINVQRSWN
jgi:hypothetical protein